MGTSRPIFCTVDQQYVGLLNFWDPVASRLLANAQILLSFYRASAHQCLRAILEFRLSVRHAQVLYQNGVTDHTFFCVWYFHHSSFHSTKHLCEIPTRSPTYTEVMQLGCKNFTFLPISGCIWETIQDRIIVTMVTGSCCKVMPYYCYFLCAACARSVSDSKVSCWNFLMDDTPNPARKPIDTTPWEAEILGQRIWCYSCSILQACFSKNTTRDAR